MEQLQHGFSDSTPREGSDKLQKSAKSLLKHYNYCPLVKQAPKSMGHAILPVLNHKKNPSNKRTSKKSFWIYIFAYLKLNNFLIFSFFTVTNYFQSNCFLINNHLNLKFAVEPWTLFRKWIIDLCRWMNIFPKYVIACGNW